MASLVFRRCLWSHGCSGRQRARPPARLGVLTSFGAAPRSPARPRRLAISHVIPPRLFQTLNSDRWNCNVCGGPPKVTVGNYVRLFWEPGPVAPAISHAIPLNVFHGLKSDRWNSAESTLVRGWAELELHAELWDGSSSPRWRLSLRGIALLGQALHCLVASAMLCYLVHWSCI